MAYHLEQNLTLPLEREHEGWVIRGIEDYARELGLGLKVCSVSPMDENTWPADEVLMFRSKLFGLQFKRSYLGAGEVKWEIDPSSDQYTKICAAKEIFYALPSYTNRALRRTALHHCLFWRPCETCCDNPIGPPCITGGKQTRAKLAKCGCFAPSRWGDFVEGLYRCELVEPNETGANLGQVARRMLSLFRERSERPLDRQAGDAGELDDTLLLVALEVR